MWIEKTNGKYRAIERYKDPLTGKDRRVSVVMEKNTASSRKAAERILISRIMEKTDSGGFDANVTVGELAEHWLCSKKETVKDSSYETYEASARSFIRFLGEDTLVKNLTPRSINRRLDVECNSTAHRNTMICRIKSIIRWGYVNDYVDDLLWLNKIITLPDKAKKEKLAKKYMEYEELIMLINGIKSNRWRDLTCFLALTGVRIGEALALEFNDIDLNERVIKITKTLNPHLHTIDTPKTTTSVRDVYIQDDLMPLCKKLRSQASANRMVNSRVFPDCRYTSYRSYLVRYSTEILKREITPHVLRHTHVALLAEQGVPLDVISRRLGHHNSDVTRDVYYHVTKRLKEKDNAVLKSISFG